MVKRGSGAFSKLESEEKRGVFGLLYESCHLSRVFCLFWESTVSFNTYFTPNFFWDEVGFRNIGLGFEKVV